MELVDQLTVTRRARNQPSGTIELLKGDLSEIPAQHAVDALVVSAFPNDYAPVPGTLFGALSERGLNMRKVAQAKAEDQRERLGCWVSKQIPAELTAQFNFKRVICFEPRYPAFLESSGVSMENIEATVGYVFRCLNNFVIPDLVGADTARQFEIRSIAMPLLATGNQGVPVEAMLPELLKAAIFWLGEGLPIERLKIVAFSPRDVSIGTATRSIATATRIFAEIKRSSETGPVVHSSSDTDSVNKIAAELIAACTNRLADQLMSLAQEDERPVVESLFKRLGSAGVEPGKDGIDLGLDSDADSPNCDVFISYAHKQDKAVSAYVQELKQLQPHLQIFYDRSSISVGSQWIKRISEAVRGARTFVAILSPDYFVSPVCWDEFQCAKLKEYTTGTSVIQTVRLYSGAEIPSIMAIYSYYDCAEGDLIKLRSFASAWPG